MREGSVQRLGLVMTLGLRRVRPFMHSYTSAPEDTGGVSLRSWNRRGRSDQT